MRSLLHHKPPYTVLGSDSSAGTHAPTYTHHNVNICYQWWVMVIQTQLSLKTRKSRAHNMSILTFHNIIVLCLREHFSVFLLRHLHVLLPCWINPTQCPWKGKNNKQPIYSKSHSLDDGHTVYASGAPTNIHLLIHLSNIYITALFSVTGKLEPNPVRVHRQPARNLSQTNNKH